MDWSAIVIAAALGGLVLFVWYAVAWMALPHHRDDYRSCPDKEVVERAVGTLPPQDAFYVLPHMKDYPGGMKDPALAERMQSAPSALLMVFPPGPPMSGATFGRSFLLNLLEAFGLAVLVACIGDGVEGMLSRMTICSATALFVAVASQFSMANWRAAPWRFAWTSAFDKVTGYALVGVVLWLVGL